MPDIILSQIMSTNNTHTCEIEYDNDLLGTKVTVNSHTNDKVISRSSMGHHNPHRPAYWQALSTQNDDLHVKGLIRICLGFHFIYIRFYPESKILTNRSNIYAMFAVKIAYKM